MSSQSTLPWSHCLNVSSWKPLIRLGISDSSTDVWKQQRESLQMTPLLQDALRSSFCFPGFLPGRRLSCYPLSLQQVQPHTLQSSRLPCLPSATALGASAEQETCINSPCFLGLQDGNWALHDSGPGGWTGALLSPLRASDSYLPDFTVCLWHFQKFCGLRNCFHNFFFFSLVLILLFFKSAVVFVL